MLMRFMNRESKCSPRSHLLEYKQQLHFIISQFGEKRVSILPSPQLSYIGPLSISQML